MKKTVSNPILTGQSVTDYGDAKYVADPFLFVSNRDDWHLFFEIYNGDRDPDAVIGHAVSENGTEWEYDRVVLDTGFHLSFPFVFEWNGEHYMVPEQNPPDGHRVTLYRADDFPIEWQKDTVLLEPDHPPRDPVVFRWNDRWWMIVSDTDRDELHVYYADTLRQNEWKAHRSNPVVTDRPSAVRPGGRPLVCDDGIIVFYQDCVERYGHQVRSYFISELTTEAYTDEEITGSPVIEPEGNVGWNSGSMHQFDPQLVDNTWCCAVDGNIDSGREFFTSQHWSIGIYKSDDRPALSKILSKYLET